MPFQTCDCYFATLFFVIYFSFLFYIFSFPVKTLILYFISQMNDHMGGVCALISKMRSISVIYL